MWTNLLRTFFTREFNFVEIVSLFAFTSLAATVSLWWLVAYLPVVIVSTLVQVSYEL